MKVTAVIPAYNEEENISRVLETVMKSKELSQVIVVSDASTDRTAKIAQEMGAEVIALSSNKGKAGAIMAGVEATSAEIILLLDADLIGLTPQHVTDLINPIIYDNADMTIGFFTSGRVCTNLSQRITPFLNGQRAVKRELLESISNLELTKYGIEVVLSRFARANQSKVIWVEMPKMNQVMKEEKNGFLRGFIARLLMYWEIIKAFTFRLPPSS
jgi:glycosyltransferase involved in cell wall biosynthesis